MKAECLEEELSAIILEARTSIEIHTEIGRLSTTGDSLSMYFLLSPSRRLNVTTSEISP